MENYMQCHLMGSVSQIGIKAGCIPSKFACQPDRRKRTANTTERKYIIKNQRKDLIKEVQKEIENRIGRDSPSGSSDIKDALKWQRQSPIEKAMSLADFSEASPSMVSLSQMDQSEVMYPYNEQFSGTEFCSVNMAEDIDIEEHDLLENPILKQIFPDLSLLKKEIDDNDGSAVQPTYNSTTGDKACNTRTFSNKMITRSKESGIVKTKNELRKRVVANVKVVLKNIRSELLKNQRFCQICSILFLTKEAFDNHQFLYHVNKIFEKAEPKNLDDTKLHYNANQNSKNNARNPSNIDVSLQMNEMSHDNLMVNINESSGETINCKQMKPCFHCNVMFPSQQSLIDHIYEILYEKKDKCTKAKVSEEQDKEAFSKNVDQEIEMYIDETATSEGQETKHLYKCPICSYYFVVQKFYLGHLLIKHKFTKNITIKFEKFDPKCIFCKLNFENITDYNTHLRQKHRREIFKNEITDVFSTNEVMDTENNCQRQKSNELAKYRNLNKVSVVVSKVILFKCTDCNIHFLTSNAAENHIDHSKITNNLKCTYCQKCFKQNDLGLHRKQHQFSKYFTVVEVNNINSQINTLYKCLTCGIHFKTENFIAHISICEAKQPKSSYCRICDILIEPSIKDAHDSEHKLGNNCRSDFQIIERERPIQIDKNVKSKRSIKIKSGNNNNNKQFFCCDICKCSIPKGFISQDHYNCKYIIKYVCEFCGLLFSNKYINAHRKLHSDKKLKLHDFTFYNLKNHRIIRPITQFPKCIKCEKHFIHRHETKNHKCQDDTNMICSKCKIRLSDDAYILHQPFHSYVMKNNKNVELNLQKVDVKSPATKDNFYKAALYYLCKNCDIAMHDYDCSIEHCHSHRNLNEIPVDTVECTKCKLNFIAKTYEQHKKLHSSYKKEHFQCFAFDVCFFGSSHEEWQRHVFGSLSKNIIDKIIENSIYKYENNIRMVITQNGPSELTLYKCERCQGCIDHNFLRQHVENCRKNAVKYLCNTCNIPFVSKLYLNAHEENHHICNIGPRTYRIVTFNRQEDKNVNYSIAKIQKYYVFHQCRNCNVIVDKETYNSHKCDSLNCKNCNNCGLLLFETDYDKHISKHKRINSFQKTFIKVVLIGNKNIDYIMTRKSKLVSRFSGIVCDYKLYKCVRCDVCVRDLRSVSDHFCLVGAAKFKCPICDIVFDEGKMRSHLKLHETDPDFTKETVMIEHFGDEKFIKLEDESIKKSKIDDDNNATSAGIGNNPSDSNGDRNTAVKIYRCPCDLHFMDFEEVEEHSRKCSGIAKIRQSKHCFKCGLKFTPNVLFKHLLKHHSGNTNNFKYEIIENTSTKI